MIIAQKKPSFSLAAFLSLMLGVIGTIALVAKAKAEVFLENPVLFSFMGVMLMGVFYILPIYNLILKTEISIDKRRLIVKNYPFISQKIYELKELTEWELMEGSGRYGSALFLKLVFSNKEKFYVWES